MKKIFYSLLEELENGKQPVLATIIATRGSVPQVPGASALFSEGVLLSGTLGGGILEGDATRKAGEVQKHGTSIIYNFDLNADITDEIGAICGGSAMLLVDAKTENSKTVFSDLKNSIRDGKPGILISRIRWNPEVEIKRFWFEPGKPKDVSRIVELKGWNDLEGEIISCLEKRNCLYLENSQNEAIFLEPVYPQPKLIIAGAGHVGKALAHIANLLDFEITIIDDRIEYANQTNIPEADHILVEQIGEALQKIPKTPDTYIAIVTRGHRDDAEALRACIHADLPYIGMIGSRKKIRLLREKFISQGWATTMEWDRVHAPIGLEIGSVTVQEIAISISAQLVESRSREKLPGKSQNISAIILAAGSSQRMGKPKMLLTFGDSSIIETVVTNASRSSMKKIFVVLGKDADSIGKLLQDHPVECVVNQQHENGMLSSLQCGLHAIPDTTRAAMVLLGDQPMIEHRIMDQLIEKFKESGKGIILATYQGKRGHPMLFDSKYFKEVLDYSSEQNLKTLLVKHPEDIDELETDHPEILRDIDTKTDYEKELNLYNYDKNHRI